MDTTGRDARAFAKREFEPLVERLLEAGHNPDAVIGGLLMTTVAMLAAHKGFKSAGHQLVEIGQPMLDGEIEGPEA